MEELLASADRPIAPPPEDRDAPRWIFPVLARGLRRDPRARWPSMAALLEALTQDPAHNPVTGRRARIIMMASLTVYFVATWPLFDGLLNDLGGVQPGDLVVTTALTLAPFIALIWWRWRAISRSVFTLRLALWTLVMMGAMMLSRTIGWPADAPITFTMTCDLTAMTAAAAAGVQAVGRWLWLIAAILGLGAVAAALHPASVAVIFGVAMVVSLSIASVTVARVTARASP